MTVNNYEDFRSMLTHAQSCLSLFSTQLEYIKYDFSATKEKKEELEQWVKMYKNQKEELIRDYPEYYERFKAKAI